MTALDTSLGVIAQNLLRQFGKSATYHPRGTASYSTVTGLANTTSPSTISLKVLLDDSSDAYVPKSALVSQRNMVEAQGRVAYVSAKELRDKGVSANPGDAITLDSVKYNVMTVVPYYSGDLVALYQVTLKL